MSARDVLCSRVTQQELIEESESKTMIQQAWAIAHDTDTDAEMCGDDAPAVADQVDHDPPVTSSS